MSRNNKVILLLILTAGFVLRLNNLSSRSLWTDEFFTLFQSTGHGADINNLLDYLSKQREPRVLAANRVKALLKVDPAKTIKDVSRGLINTDTHPPLYFWIMHIWMNRFGDSVFVIRFFSLLMGLVSIILAYYIGRHLFNEGAGIFSALFVSISAFGVRYSQEARAYSLIMALGLLSWFFVLRFEKYNKDRDLYWFAVFSALGFYTHYFYFFIPLAQFIYFSCVYINHTGKIRRFYSAFLLSLLLFVPWFLALILKGYNFRNAEWIFGYPGLNNKIYYAFSGIIRYFFVFDNFAVSEHILLLSGLALFILAVSFAIREIRDKYPRESLFCLLMFFVPLSGMLFIDILEHGALLKQERFWTFSFLGFMPVAGYFLNYAFLKKKLFAYVFIALMLVSSIAAAGEQFGPAPKEASLWINKESGARPSVAVVYNIRSAVLAQAYYLEKNIFLLPVSDDRQLSEGLKSSSSYAQNIFIVRHFHRTDASLMDQPFMEVKDAGPEFKLKTEIKKDDIKVTEFVRCGL